MADRAISELTAVTTVTEDDSFVLEQNKRAMRLSGRTLINFLATQLDGHGGISSIAKTGTSGLVDTYTITYADTTTSTYTVTNGAQGATGDQTYVWIMYSSEEPTSDADMHSTADDWIGIYAGLSSTAPTTYTSYDWYKYKGETGDTPTVTDTETLYQRSNTSSVTPSTWQEEIPDVPSGWFLWTKTTIEFSTEDECTFYTCVRNGVDGEGAVGSVCGVTPDANGDVDLMYVSGTRLIIG